MAFRDRFLGATAPLGARTEDEWRAGLRRRLDDDTIALAILALREHLRGCRSWLRSESAPVATDAEPCLPRQSEGAEPSGEEVEAATRAAYLRYCRIDPGLFPWESMTAEGQARWREAVMAGLSAMKRHREERRGG